jgi:hypothetical protein
MIRVVASILVNGIALLHYLTKLHGLELLGYEAEPWTVGSAEKNKARQTFADHVKTSSITSSDVSPYLRQC